MIGSEDELAYQPSAHVATMLRDSGVSAELQRILGAIRRLDDTTLAAAESHRSAEKRLHEGTLTQAEADAISDAATAAAPHAFNVLVLLSALNFVARSVDAAHPELVMPSALARILDALKGIDNELNNYISDRDADRWPTCSTPELRTSTRYSGTASATGCCPKTPPARGR